MSPAVDEARLEEVRALRAMATALLDVIAENRGHIPFCVGVDGLSPCTEIVCHNARNAVAWAVRLGIVDRPAWMRDHS